MSNNQISTPQEKQYFWRQKQIKIFYGYGRPIFNTTIENCHIRKHYDVKRYFTCQTELHKKYPYYDLHNKNFVE